MTWNGTVFYGVVFSGNQGENEIINGLLDEDDPDWDLADVVGYHRGTLNDDDSFEDRMAVRQKIAEEFDALEFDISGFSEYPFYQIQIKESETTSYGEPSQIDPSNNTVSWDADLRRILIEIGVDAKYVEGPGWFVSAYHD